jgi:ketosteroid isomerase-like protein
LSDSAIDHYESELTFLSIQIHNGLDKDLEVFAGGSMSAREILKEYELNINKHDFDLVEPLLSAECKFWFSSGTYEGLDQTRKAFEKTWGMIKDEAYSISEQNWIAESDQAAVCTYHFHWQGLIEGKPCEGKGRGTSCFRKDVNGWKIIHEHLSHFPK